MALLLDTSVIVWWRLADPRLSELVRDRLTRGDDDIVISVVSAWEYGQKRRKRPNELPFSFAQLIEAIPHQPLDLAFGVHGHAETLPPIHDDPFDRMLIAQALHHGLTLVASDANIQRYPVDVFW